jgi:hypothetical protein
MLWIEQVVGALSSAVKDTAATDFVDRFRDYADQIGTPMPTWLTTEFVAAVQERMRQLLGQWRATARGQRLVLDWPAPT